MGAGGERRSYGGLWGRGPPGGGTFWGPVEGGDRLSALSVHLCVVEQGAWKAAPGRGTESTRPPFTRGLQTVRDGFSWTPLQGVAFKR